MNNLFSPAEKKLLACYTQPMTMNLCIIGTGFVGVVSAAVFASFGNKTVGLDVDQKKIDKLKQGIVPFYEPGLTELLIQQQQLGNLTFTTNYQEAIKDADVIIIAVGTPSAPDGKADLKYVFMSAETLAPFIKPNVIIAIKSTVPPGTLDKMSERIREKTQTPFFTASLAEFLKEGSAVDDTFHPDRVVIGAIEPEVAERLKELHKPLNAPMVVIRPESAQMAKYTANAYLATRITFINQIADLCEQNGADIQEIIEAIGYDKRIGKHYWYPGLGYGGSCFSADETVFSLNSPNVATQRIDTLFKNEKKDTITQRDLSVRLPKDKRVLAFDLETRRPVIADITAITSRPYSGIMVTIKTSMGRVMTVTADHPVILWDKDKTKVVPAIMVQKHDEVMALTKLPAVKQAKQLNLIESLKGTELEKSVYVSAIDNSFSRLYQSYASHITKKMLRYPEEIKSGNRMSLLLYRHLSEKGVINLDSNILQLYTAKGAATKINTLIEVDEDLMRLCGYYLAEGYITSDVGRKNAVRDRIGFTFHELEHEYISDVRRILSKYGMKYSERKGPGAIDTRVSSRVFAWFIRDVLKMGIKSEDKELPRLAFNVSESLRFELLRGAFSGDGSVTKLQKNKNMMFEYATVSKLFADGLALMLQSLGVVPSIRYRMMNKSKKLAYILRISGYKQMKKMENIFGQKRLDTIQTVLNGYQKVIAQRGFIHEDSFARLTIMSVEKQLVDTHVYSLETTAHTVISSSGLISHNCFPKDVKELAAYSRAVDEGDNLLNKMSEINEQRIWKLLDKYGKMIVGWENKNVAVLGLSFKPNTDDMREAPSTKVVPYLLNHDAKVTGFDPKAVEVVKYFIPEHKNARYTADIAEAAQNADVLLALIEWPEITGHDFSAYRKTDKEQWFIDVRNQFDPQKVKAWGYKYIGIGRGHTNSTSSSSNEKK